MCKELGISPKKQSNTLKRSWSSDLQFPADVAIAREAQVPALKASSSQMLVTPAPRDSAPSSEP